MSQDDPWLDGIAVIRVIAEQAEHYGIAKQECREWMAKVGRIFATCCPLRQPDDIQPLQTIYFKYCLDRIDVIFSVFIRLPRAFADLSCSHRLA